MRYCDILALFIVQRSLQQSAAIHLLLLLPLRCIVIDHCIFRPAASPEDHNFSSNVCPFRGRRFLARLGLHARLFLLRKSITYV